MAVNPSINALKKRPMPGFEHTEGAVVNSDIEMMHTNDCSCDKHIQLRKVVEQVNERRTDTVTSPLR